MNFLDPTIYFILGFAFGGISFFLIYFITNKLKKNSNNSDIELGSINENIRNIQKELQDFNLIQDRIELSIIKGGSKKKSNQQQLIEHSPMK